MSETKICIIGAGLCGSLLATRLAQRGLNVDVYEKRPDLRKVELAAGRSINLALSDRGFKALRMIGVEDEVRKQVIPMYGRMIHPLEGDQKLYRYSGRERDYINSVSRPGLNAFLLDKADNYDNLDLYFQSNCTKVNLESGEIELRDQLGNTVKKTYDVIIGTDGAGSIVRRSMSKMSNRIRFNFSQQFLDTGYKELTIPPGPNGSYLIDKHALHIWPRDGFMKIALPNLDGSFTVTLFAKFEGPNSFEDWDSDKKVRELFKSSFPDTYDIMPDLIKDWHENPSSSLGTIKCWPWQYKGRALIMGDAAHAIVPFYGQGMNCALEDVVVFDEMIEKHGLDWEKILKDYDDLRKPSADAIADLAEDNFYEMRDATADPVFNKKRILELKLEQEDPSYFSKYSLVTFREDIPYERAMEQGRAQNMVLMDIARQTDDPNSLSAKALKELLQKALPQYIN